MFPTTHAFIYQPAATSGQMRDLGVLGGFFSYGMAINAYNHIAGYSTLQPNSERVHGFLYINGKGMIDVGSLGAKGTDTDASVALGVNRFDQVVGYSYLPGVGKTPLQQVAFLWFRNSNGVGKMINLNQLLVASQSNYLLTAATAINDNGQIVANAWDIKNGGPRAVLLTPTGPATH
jgi:probable HAF family extracellular repeat protein